MISFDHPVTGIEEFEADSEQDALKMATDKYGGGKTNFYVSIFKENTTTEEVRDTGDVRHADGVHDTSGGNQSEGSAEGL